MSEFVEPRVNSACAPAAALRLVILCLQEELGRAFLKGILPEATGLSGQTEIEGLPLRVDVLAGEPRRVEGWDEAVRQAHGCAMLVRFLDVVSLEAIRAIYSRLPAEKHLPLAVLLFRNEGEIDFKISCPACGQKLWVSDGDTGKRGRCPNCHKAFPLPSQAGHLKAQLMLPDAIPILTVLNGRLTSCRGALVGLVAQMRAAHPPPAGTDQDILKKATVKMEMTGGSR